MLYLRAMNLNPNSPIFHVVPVQAASGSCSSGYSSRKHPGPVEALKQMLFSLQAVEQQVSLENEKEVTAENGTEKEVTSENGSTPTLEDGTQPQIIMVLRMR